MTLLRPLQESVGPSHHGDAGAAAGFDGVSLLVVALVLAAVLSLGWYAWRLLRSRRFE